jgi:type IV pilus assembly protein PilM
MKTSTQMNALAERIIRTARRSNSTRIGPIGFDCSLSVLHLVQLQTTADGRISLHATASLPYPEPRETLLAEPKKMRSLIQRAMKADSFQGKQIVSILPASDTRIMPVSYHVEEGQSDDAALLNLLSERVDDDLREYVIDYQPVRSAESSADRLAIVALARREAVIGYLEMLRKAGLETRQLEIGPAAIRRLVSAMSPQNRYENVLAINFGRRVSYITVLSGNRLLFDQEIHFGETGLLEKIASELDMTVESVRVLLENNNIAPGPVPVHAGDREIDAAGTLQEIIKPMLRGLTEEINRVLVYTASQTRGETVSRIYLLGSLARWQGMDGLLNSQVKLPVETIPDPLKIFGSDEKPSGSRQPQPEIAVAMGLALNGLDKDG